MAVNFPNSPTVGDTHTHLGIEWICTKSTGADVRWAKTGDDIFNSLHLGAFAVEPVLDNDGNALIAGQTFFNTTTSEVGFYNGSAWEYPAAETAADLVATNADVVSTNADVVTTNADVVTTNADVVTTNANVTYSAEWANKAEDSLISVAAGGDNVDDYSALHHANKAAASASAASTSEANAAASFNSFDDRYLGAKSSDPALDNDGNALITGALYFNSTTNLMRVYTGAAWSVAAFDASGALVAANNLSDLTNAGTARTNLGVAIGTDVQAYDANTSKLDVAETRSASINFADNILQRAILKDTAEELSAIGNTGATQTFDCTVANVFTATLDQNCTFTFSNPPASGDLGYIVIYGTNFGAFTITYPASVDWPSATAPTLTASGLDILVFETYDAGTTWLGQVAALDVK